MSRGCRPGTSRRTGFWPTAEGKNSMPACADAMRASGVADALVEADRRARALQRVELASEQVVLATGRAVDIVAHYGASNIGDAFTRITGADEEKISA